MTQEMNFEQILADLDCVKLLVLEQLSMLVWNILIQESYSSEVMKLRKVKNLCHQLQKDLSHHTRSRPQGIHTLSHS